MIQSRWKSPVVWSTIAALVFFVLKTCGLLAPLGLTEDSFKELTAIILSVLAAFGILNNPTEAKRF